MGDIISAGASIFSSVENSGKAQDLANSQAVNDQMLALINRKTATDAANIAADTTLASIDKANQFNAEQTAISRGAPNPALGGATSAILPYYMSGQEQSMARDAESLYAAISAFNDGTPAGIPNIPLGLTTGTGNSGASRWFPTINQSGTTVNPALAGQPQSTPTFDVASGKWVQAGAPGVQGSFSNMPQLRALAAANGDKRPTLSGLSTDPNNRFAQMLQQYQAIIDSQNPSYAANEALVARLATGGITKDMLDEAAPVFQARLDTATSTGNSLIDALHKTLAQTDAIQARKGFTGDSFGNRLMNTAARLGAAEDVSALRSNALLTNAQEKQGIFNTGRNLRLNNLGLPDQVVAAALNRKDMAVNAAENSFANQVAVTNPFRISQSTTAPSSHAQIQPANIPFQQPTQQPYLPSNAGLISQGIGGIANGLSSGGLSTGNLISSLLKGSTPKTSFVPVSGTNDMFDSGFNYGGGGGGSSMDSYDASWPFG